MENKVLDIIIPIFGKEPVYIENNFSKILNEIPNNVNLIFIYKNSEELNYDFLLNYKAENIIVKKVPQSFQKTNKVKEGIKLSSANWILVLDSHHKFTINGLNRIIKKLENSKNEVNLFWILNRWENSDTNKCKIFTKQGINFIFESGKYILRRDLLNGIEESIEYDIVYADDCTLGLFAFLTTKPHPTFFIKKFYIRTFGGKLSETYGWEGGSLDKKMTMKFEIGEIFNHFIKEVEKIGIEKLSVEFQRTLYFLFKTYYRVCSNVYFGFTGNFKNEDYTLILKEMFGNHYKNYSILINELYKNSFSALQFKRYNFLTNRHLKKILEANKYEN